MNCTVRTGVHHSLHTLVASESVDAIAAASSYWPLVRDDGEGPGPLAGHHCRMGRMARGANFLSALQAAITPCSNQLVLCGGRVLREHMGGIEEGIPKPVAAAKCGP